jgi:hypothetical protein
MSEKNTPAPPPKDPEPTRNPGGFWEPRTAEKEQQAGISPKK